MHGIHVQKTRTHEITNFVQILNESMKLVSLWYNQKQQKESSVLKNKNLDFVIWKLFIQSKNFK